MQRERAISTTAGVAVEAAREAVTLGARVYLAAECALLFGVPPLLFYLDVLPLGWLIPVLVGTGAALFAILLASKDFDSRRFGGFTSFFTEWRRVLPLFIAGAVVLTLLTPLVLPAGRGLFNFPLRAPESWALIMVLYPLFSVYPQEVIFRGFFFHRYRNLFTTPASMIAASAFAFGWGHLFFEHPLSIVLTIVAGVFFAWTYHRTQRLGAAAVEHALYGDWCFTVGIGWIFFTGSVGA